MHYDIMMHFRDVLSSVDVCKFQQVLISDNSILITDDNSNVRTAVSSVSNNSTAPILLTKSSISKRRKRQAATATTTPHPGAIKTGKLPPGCRYGKAKLFYSNKFSSFLLHFKTINC